jgi:hypothetical protein
MLILLTGLSLLAWFSTYSGMLELIAAGSGEIGTFEKIAIGFAVLMLQGMIVYILDALFSGQLRLILYPLYIFGYIILVLISVAFAFGFYWRFLEAGSQTTQAAGASVFRVQQALQGGQSRLEQLQSTFAQLTRISNEKAERERTVGGTCPNSRPGDGPRRRLREADAQRFQFAASLIDTRTNAVKTDIADLNTELQKLLRKDPSTIDAATQTRTPFIEDLDRKIGLVITRFNQLRNEPQLRQIRDEFAARANQVNFPDERNQPFPCPDPQLQIALNGVVRSIDTFPELQKPELRSVEGSEAVIEAFRRLSNTAVSLVTKGKLPPTPEQLREQGIQSAQTGVPNVAEDRAGLSERDYIPLMIAIFVDVCILLVSVNRPFGPMFNIGRDVSYARSRGPMQGVLGTFYRVFQNQFGDDTRPTPLQLIAPLQDVVFDYEGDYYAAAPLDFREDTYRDWLEARRTSKTDSIFDPRNPESLRPLETSRYISAVFVALDGEDIVRLQGTSRKTSPLGGTAQGPNEDEVRDRLNRQGSVYAQADAFRIYKFRNRRAWADLQNSILGSTAETEELARKAERRRRTQEQREQDRGVLEGVSSQPTRLTKQESAPPPKLLPQQQASASSDMVHDVQDVKEDAKTT